MPGTTRRASEAGAAEDLAGAGVDVDPHHLRPAHELQAIAAGESVQLRAEIGEAAHPGHDPLLEVAKRHEAPGAAASERLVLLALVRARVGKGAGEDDAQSGGKGKDRLHGISASLGRGDSPPPLNR